MKDDEEVYHNGNGYVEFYRTNNPKKTSLRMKAKKKSNQKNSTSIPAPLTNEFKVIKKSVICYIEN